MTAEIVDPQRALEILSSPEFTHHPWADVFRLVAKGKIAFLSVINTQEPWAVPRPECVIQIGDDMPRPYPPAQGPDGFHKPSLVRAMRYIQNAGGGVILQICHFHRPTIAEVGNCAAGGRTMMVIESTDRREIEWAKFLQDNQVDNMPGIAIFSNHAVKQ
jgi:hypothetical protein